MGKETNQRFIGLDALKGLAIIAVVLYHFGGNVLPYGYLGVDIFFVIGGYLLVRQLSSQFEKQEFNYWKFIFRKCVRLWPLIVISVVLALGIGYFLMLPNDYENLAESAVASSVFVNNILQCITTKNYWDIVNIYKPLMHLWYVGVLMQAYVVLPLIYLVVVKLCKKTRQGMLVTTVVITASSFLLFVLPFFSSAWKFYYLPFRLFEITGGGLLAFQSKSFVNKADKVGSVFSLAILIALLCSRWELGSASMMLVITVLATLTFIEASKEVQYEGLVKAVVNIFAYLGKRSYSIYIWHQVIIAFLFYSIFPRQSIISFLVLICLTALISLLSYQFVEKPMGNVVHNKKKESMVIITSIAVAAAVSLVSIVVYFHAGVVRDVPELEITKDTAHRGMHSEYCDRVYDWDRPFNDDSESKILVIGNSFGRDWANILYEYDNELDISFLYYSEDALLDNIDRINEADFVFYALGLAYGSVPDLVADTVSPEKLYIISNKNYGASNGIIYAHRGDENYYSQTVEYLTALDEDIKSNAEIWGDHYINMMTPVLTDDNEVRVFTDTNMLISQDCRHLTHAGAQYYARMLDIASILDLE